MWIRNSEGPEQSPSGVLLTWTHPHSARSEYKPEQGCFVEAHSVQTESFSSINPAYFLPAASKLFHVGFLIAQIAAAVWWINDIINFWLWTNNTCHNWLEVLKTKNVNKQQPVTASLNLSWCWFSHSGAVTFQQEVDHVRLPRRVVLFIGYLITRPGEHALLLKTSVK